MQVLITWPVASGVKYLWGLQFAYNNGIFVSR